ncbi:MAG: histidinol-phosphatase [Fibrobacter sp.]|nr:histidinol-phosphatase [Fibrobacter sp.]
MSSDIKKYDIFRYGSTWARADFHLHTRSDKQFAYTGEENSFLNDYVSKLKSAFINVGVITNHNKFKKDEFVNLRKNARKEEIFLLPGIELSVNDGSNGIHTLVVFSDAWLEDGQDYINQFLNVAFQGKIQAQYEQEDGRSSLCLIDTIKKLDGYHRDYFLIFAHVEQSSGVWKELDGGRIGELGADELFKKRTLGFQKVRTHDVADRTCRTKVQSWFGGWYPAEVEGSDCKSIDEIGTKDGETWLKIGDFTFESVKYALTDHNNRVRNAKPERYKHSNIKSISFEGGTLNGQTVYLSPELNTFIGIRGSGKSSILETVRYVLDIPFGDHAIDTGYKQKLVAHTLGSGGKAIITALDQYGREFQISRILNDYSQCYVDGILQPGISIRETIIKNPIYFGQKDLSSSSDGFETDLVEKLVGDSLHNIRLRIEEKKQQVSDAVTRLQKLATIDDQIEDYKQKKQDAEFNLIKFTEHGIEEKFKKQTDFETDERKIKQMLIDIETFGNGLESFIGEYEDTIKNHTSYVSTQSPEFFKQFLTEYNKAVQILEKQQADKLALENLLKQLKESYTSFLQTKKKFTDEFADTRRKIEYELKVKGAVTLNLEEYPHLKSKIDTADKMLVALEKQKSQKDTVKTELMILLTELNDLLQQEFHAINGQLAKINDKHSVLTIEAEFKGDKKGFLLFVKNVFRGSNIWENTLQKLVKEYDDFGHIYRDLENAKNKAGSSPETFEKYFLDNLQTLLVFQVQNKFTIRYRGKELQHHSLGQRASALILFILSQHENDVIIVDQPEDDLDNQTIYEDVIKLIRNLKPDTQFLFATHNANFPVLGDAEQIHSCRYTDGRIAIQAGSIDSPVLQKEIVDIMEGGEDAFNKRKEIYGIWKPQNLLR